MTIRFLTTTLLLILFLQLAYTGILMLDEDEGFVALWHTYVGIAFIVVAVVHFLLNLSLYKNEAKIFLRK
ncbi:MAG: DUF4405 domain-containing protein [Candidatus Diapherotrites archaeon]|nr:DUF4405 domain-containing protein [Candidatus Diapherotrites archaeon]